MRHALLLGALVLAACSSEDPPVTQTADTGVPPGDTGGDAFVQDPAIAVPCADAEAAVFGDPGMLPAEKGAIIKCFQGRKIAKADLEAQARANGYTGKAFTSGAKVFKISYRTERGDLAKTPGYSSAIVMLPDTPRAAKSPLMLVAHGSRGQMNKCAPSAETTEGEYVRSDFENMTFPLVGAGLPVIAPDNAGYANYGGANNPPPTYAAAEDIAKSLLDGTRAFRKLAPSVIDDNVVLFGHSQGGHSALAALAFTDSYGLAGKLSAVVVFAPLWLSQRTWGALGYLPAIFNFNDYRAANAVSIWYHYTHAELLDGKGKGADIYKPEKRAQIKQFVDTLCWAADYPLLTAMGKDPSDIMDPSFVDAVGAAAGAGEPCPTDEPKKAMCEKWMGRYAADRPHIMGNAAKVPILFLYGNKDTTIPPDRVSCARDRLKTDMAAVTYCVEPEQDHSGIVKARTSYAIEWLLSKAAGAPAPMPCEKGEADISASCNPVPPND
jgi:pimeloyl-ACP methyl ester carboxylesterase